MFGDVVEIPQNEKTPFNPVSPYATSKLFSYYISKNFRDAFGMFVCNGILFNHESPLRGEEFVTKKIVKNLKKIQDGSLECFYLGNIYSKRDWGFAGDYVEAIWKMMQKKKSEDYVISTGEQYSVKDFVNIASKFFGFNLVWRGKGLNEIAFDKINKKVIVRIDKKLYRPNEVGNLIGDYSKAREELNWKPKVNFYKLVEMMCSYESKLSNKKC
jgi:GDPmannose 4,6-dehydratase